MSYGTTARQLSLAFALTLPLLIPFDAGRNIDLQGWILIIAGGFAVISLIASRQWLHIAGAEAVIFGLFSFWCLLSSFINHPIGTNIWGAPFLRIGSLSLLSCIALGLIVREIPYQKLITWLYCYGSLIGYLSLIYSWLHFHSFIRLVGVFAQADIMACTLGVTILLGWQFTSHALQRWHIGNQLALFALLLLTQTRAVIFLTVLLSAIILHHRRALTIKQLGMAAIVSILTIGFVIVVTPSNRLSNGSYLQESVAYRRDLQVSGISATSHKPILGYGLGHIDEAFSCSSLHKASLLASCNAGYFISSSHNIYLDRILGIGWIGGLAFLAIVLRSLYRAAWRSSLLPYAAVLIAGYYLTNVTSIVLELVFWVLLLHQHEPQMNSPKKT